jgi:transposase
VLSINLRRHDRTEGGINIDDAVAFPLTDATEPPRVCRRLKSLRTWSHKQSQKIFWVRERAIRLVLEAAPNHTSQWAAIRSIAEKVGCTLQTLSSWIRQSERDQGRRPGQTNDDRGRLKKLERENRELRRANEILRKASAYFAQAELDRRPK